MKLSAWHKLVIFLRCVKAAFSIRIRDGNVRKLTFLPRWLCSLSKKQIFTRSSTSSKSKLLLPKIDILALRRLGDKGFPRICNWKSKFKRIFQHFLLLTFLFGIFAFFLFGKTFFRRSSFVRPSFFGWFWMLLLLPPLLSDSDKLSKLSDRKAHTFRNVWRKRSLQTLSDETLFTCDPP